jgi:hypothetical protein
MELRERAGRIEQLGKDGELAAARGALPALIASFERSRDAMRDFLEEMANL